MTEEKENKAQEVYMEFQVLEQRIKQLQQQLEAVTNHLMELNATGNSLEEFRKIKNEKEVFVPLSSGIFVKASIKDNSELLVNVGANVVVKKSIDATKSIISNQIEEIKKIQKQMLNELEKMTNHAAQLEMQLQSLIPQG